MLALSSEISQTLLKISEKAPALSNEQIPADFVQLAKRGTPVGGFCSRIADNVTFMNQVCRGKSLAFEVVLY